MIQAVIFDLDGTMINSEDAALIAWKNMAKQVGQPFSDADFALIHGVRLDQSLQNVLAHWNADLIGLTAEKMLDILKIEWQTAKQHIALMPGVHELHDALAEQEMPWAIATASTRDYTKQMVTQFSLERRVTIACGDEVVDSKPAPDIFLLAAERLNIPPQHCLAIEDSVPGHEAAASAGMRVIVIPTPFNTPDQFPQADYIFSSLHEVRQQLPQLLQ